MVNPFQPSNRYIPDKAAETLMNPLSLPIFSCFTIQNPEYYLAVHLWQPHNVMSSVNDA